MFFNKIAVCLFLAASSQQAYASSTTSIINKFGYQLGLEGKYLSWSGTPLIFKSYPNEGKAGELILKNGQCLILDSEKRLTTGKCNGSKFRSKAFGSTNQISIGNLCLADDEGYAAAFPCSSKKAGNFVMFDHPHSHKNIIKTAPIEDSTWGKRVLVQVNDVKSQYKGKYIIATISSGITGCISAGKKCKTWPNADVGLSALFDPKKPQLYPCNPKAQVNTKSWCHQ
eukprot:Awhi_evm1s14791